jgi:hypothetical protein
MILDQRCELGKRVELRRLELRTSDCRQHVHPSPSPQVTVPQRPLQSVRVRAGCGTFVLYSPGREQRS